MPIQRQALVDCLQQMKTIYLTAPEASVRSQKFINVLHDYCITELHRVGIDDSNFQIIKEATIYGSHKPKDVDVAVIENINGPQIIIGIRSQMSSVAKNILTYYEEIIGDCISLHDRFPMAVLCYVYLLPKQPIKDGLVESVNLERAEQLFERITGRNDWRATKDKYEHFAFLKIDFENDPPTLIDTIPILSIDNFFDNILKTYNDRKPL
ncbi:MAG: hypothetical protein Ta2B_09730 [Termitinemataceae bacterium]|nr:MAG: hypothetical protein Ta2B_09730 [Termitinemataceae bacterium]